LVKGGGMTKLKYPISSIKIFGVGKKALLADDPKNRCTKRGGRRKNPRGGE